MIWKFLTQNGLFPKGLSWVQHWVSRIECFHSCGQHLCKFIGTKESVCRRFIVLGHQYGRCDVMWKHSIGLWQPRSIIHNFHITHNAACLLPKFCIWENYIENNSYAKFGSGKGKQVELWTMWKIGPDCLLFVVICPINTTRSPGVMGSLYCPWYND